MTPTPSGYHRVLPCLEGSVICRTSLCFSTPTFSCSTLPQAPYLASCTASAPSHLLVQDSWLRLQALLPQPDLATPAEMDAYNLRITELRKYVVLNYVACIKAVKKRNRHMAKCGPAAGNLHATALLSRQPFFTSPRLAALQTQAEVLAQVRLPPKTPCCTCCTHLQLSPITRASSQAHAGSMLSMGQLQDDQAAVHAEAEQCRSSLDPRI